VDNQLEEVLARCAVSIEAHCKIMHPERFTRPFSKGHKQLFELIDDWSIQRLLVIAHRGFGKTSIFNYAVPSQAIAFGKAKFIVPVSATATSAVLSSDNLRRELMTNMSFKPLITDIKPEGREEAFSKTMWTTSNGVLVFPRSPGQQTRGILHGNNRPDLILPDDLETPEGVMNPEQRKKISEWFKTDLANAVDRSSNNWRIMMTGSILHEDCLLQNFKESDNWVVHEMPLCDDEYQTYWTEYKTTKGIAELREEYKDNLDQFAREFMNLPISKEDASFRQEFFKYYDEVELKLNDNPKVETVILVDPAKTLNQTSASTGIVGVGLNLATNAIYVRDAINAKISPDKIYDEIFKMAERLKAKVIGVEVTSLNEFIVQPLKNEMLRRGLHFEIVELKARKGEGEFAGPHKAKIGRIAALIPYYRQGLIYHNRGCSGPLELQLLAYPRARRWDLMDAFAYIVEMMELGGRYFEHIAGEDNPTTGEEDYDKLLKEDEDLDWDEYDVDDPLEELGYLCEGMLV